MSVDTPTAPTVVLPGPATAAGRGRTGGRGVLTVLGVGVSAAATGAAVGLAWSTLTGDSMGLWLTARVTGLVSYLLLTAVTLMGLALAHPARSRWTWPSPASRLRVHAALTVFTLALIAIHIVVLVLDPWAQVGWAGALLPFGSDYRPLAVTLGLLSLWAGLIAGASAALAGRTGWRLWRPLHRVAAATWVLAWLHGVLAGSDTAAWLPLYAATGLAVMATAVWRYTSRSARPTTEVSR